MHKTNKLKIRKHCRDKLKIQIEELEFRKLNIVNLLIFPSDLQIQCDPNQNHCSVVVFFVEIDKPILICTWKCKELKIALKNPKEEKLRGLTLYDFNTIIKLY